jgi:hypothetical protein
VALEAAGMQAAHGKHRPGGAEEDDGQRFDHAAPVHRGTAQQQSPAGWCRPKTAKPPTEGDRHATGQSNPPPSESTIA